MVEYIYRVDELRPFRDRIFLQDLEILESKRPKKLPLEPGVAVRRADRLFAAYRRMLTRVGLCYGGPYAVTLSSGMRTRRE